MQVFTGYITDIIDIAIVSYIIYQLLILLKGTRAVQLLKGISILVFIWLVSNFLHFTTLRWLIENLFSVGVIAVIIIFQPELRRALEQLGRGGFLLKNYQFEEQLVTRVVTEVKKTVSYLSKNYIGALIVIERQTGLLDYIETGIKLSANLSSELLKNIFLPNTPLHDGAVILRKDEIVAAGCYLPLSENPFLSKELGTRHRAGIGISEISDAVVVIVSEETGKISLVVMGNIIRDINHEQLHIRLFEELKPSKQRNIAPLFVKKEQKDE